jgi:hypothetical protein
MITRRRKEWNDLEKRMGEKISAKVARYGLPKRRRPVHLNLLDLITLTILG